MNNKFMDISSSPTTILSTGSELNLCPLLVKNIIVYNKGTQNIKFNLRRERIKNYPITLFLINEFLIRPYETIDLIEKFGLQIVFEYNTSPSISDSLVCFSNDYTQIFDCEVNVESL